MIRRLHILEIRAYNSQEGARVIGSVEREFRFCYDTRTVLNRYITVKMKTKNKNIRVPYALTVYGKEEITAVNKVLKDPTKIVAGPLVKKFESKIASLFGKKYGIFVNSGSSANLLAFDILNIPKGSEVITPVLNFATTIAPIVQMGLVPVFVDVVAETYQINIDQIEKMITPKTKAMIVPSLIGNLPDFIRLREIANKHKLYFIEDSCDTLGPKFNSKPTGFYSDISTTSFYASHIITTAGMGGVMSVHDPILARKALIKANWGRESTLFGAYEESEELKKRMAGVLDGETYDAKFIFSEIGYNFQVTEINGAFGIAQLKRLSEFTRRRKENFKVLRKFFEQYWEYFVLPESDARSNHTWLSFPLTIKKDAPFSRLEITTFLEGCNIQTRPIFMGNALKQPGFKNISSVKRNEGYPVADHIMHYGFLIGCHQGLEAKHLQHLMGTFTEFLSGR